MLLAIPLAACDEGDDVRDVGKATAALTLFSEGFESGDLSLWDATSGDASASTHSNAVLTGSYGGRLVGDAEVRVTLDTSAYTNVTLSYSRNSYSMESSDFLRVRYSTDGGASWASLEDAPGSFSWTSVGPLAMPAHPTLTISFWADQSSSFDYVYLDDILVSGDETAPGCTSAADCDDQDPCTDDVCSAGACSNPAYPVSPRVACPGGVCDGAGNCVQCVTGSDCPDDGDACTEAPACRSQLCEHDPVQCDDGAYCNGVETCNSATGCVAGTAPLVDDGIACTADSCDEVNDEIDNVPTHTACPDDGDGNECTVGICDPMTAGDAIGCIFEPAMNGSACSLGECLAAECVECSDDGDCPMEETCDATTHTCGCAASCDAPEFAGRCGTFDAGCAGTIECGCATEVGEFCSEAGYCTLPCDSRVRDFDETGRDCGGGCGPCTEQSCSDGVDDDGDTLVDCDDSDCSGAGQCDRCEPEPLGRIAVPYMEPQAFAPAPGTLEISLGDVGGQCDVLGPASFAVGSTGFAEYVLPDATVACLAGRRTLELSVTDPASGTRRTWEQSSDELFTAEVDAGELLSVRLVVTHTSYDTATGTLAVDFRYEALGYARSNLDCLPCGDFDPGSLSPQFCSDRCRCDLGEGGCQDDDDCRRGLVCADAADLYGIMAAGIRVCVPEACDNGVQDGDETGLDCGGSLCGACPSDCAAQVGCSPQCPCPAYDGPCDQDADCGGGAVCGFDAGPRFGRPELQDVCIPGTCEASGCGSSECGPCGACEYQVTDCVAGGGTRVETLPLGTTSLRDTPATFVNDADVVEWVPAHVLRRRSGLALFEGERTNLLVDSRAPEDWADENASADPSAPSPLTYVDPTGLAPAYPVRVQAQAAGGAGLTRAAVASGRPGAIVVGSAYHSPGNVAPATPVVLLGGTDDPATSGFSVEAANGSWTRTAVRTALPAASTPLDFWLRLEDYGVGGVAQDDRADFALPQLEVGAFPSSYIPTEGTVAARAVDRVVIDGASVPEWFWNGSWSMNVQPIWDSTLLAGVTQRFVLFELGGRADYWIGFEADPNFDEYDTGRALKLVVQAGTARRASAAFEITAGETIIAYLNPSTGLVTTEQNGDNVIPQDPWSWPRQPLSVGARGSGSDDESIYAWLGAPTADVDVPDTCDLQIYPDGTPCGPGAQRCEAGTCLLSATCGDGVLDDDESCDDANNLPGDGCSPECASEALTYAQQDVALQEPGVRGHAVAADGQGRLLFVWQAADGYGSRLLAARATPAGIPVQADLDSPVVISDGLGAGWPAEPQVVGHAAGGWTVVWTHPGEAGIASRAVYRFVDPAEVGGETPPAPLPVSEGGPGDELHEGSARAAALGDGFVVVWVDERAVFSNGSERTLRARLFDADGVPVNDAFDVSQDPSNASLQPAVAAIGSQWIVAWARADDQTLRARRFDEAVPLGGEQLVARDARAPSAAALPTDGSLADFAVAYVDIPTLRTHAIELIGGMSLGAATPFAVSDLPDGRAEVAPVVAPLGADAFAVAFDYGDGQRDADFAVLERSGRLYSEQPAESDLRALLSADSNQRGIQLSAVSNGLWFTWADDSAAPQAPDASEVPLLPNQLRAFLLGCPGCELSWGPGCYTDDVKIVPSDLGATSDYPWFGWDVASSGDRAVVSAWNDGAEGTSRGSIYVYRMGESGWQRNAKLVASDLANGDRFGQDVAIDGDRIIAGASYKTDQGESRRGAAYIFDWDGSSWIETKLTSPDAGATQQFGYDVDVRGDWAMVVAPHGTGLGVVHVFHFDGATWSPVQRLDSAQYDMGGVTLGDGVALVRSDEELADFTYNSRAHVFRFDGSSWVQTQILTAPDAHPDDGFGTTSALDGNRAYIGASGLQGQYPGEGAVYVYRDDGTSFVEVQEIVGPDPLWGSNFGSAVAVDGDLLLVTEQRQGWSVSGSNPDLPLTPRVHVHRYDETRNRFLLMTTLTGPGTSGQSAYDYWGRGLAAVDGWALIGAAFEIDSAYSDYPPGALHVSSCAPAQACGDGWIAGAEECDDGNVLTESCDDGELACQVCDATCRFFNPGCGDGTVVGAYEECDDGGANGATYCPNGAAREPCDVCTSSCAIVPGGYCGDGIVNGDEECDDGNLIGGDGCENTCLEACDGGSSDPCNNVDDDCDGTVDEDGDVLCDDGNVCTADACDAGSCQNAPVSGGCDDGDACTTGDACEGGVCVGGGTLDCDDGELCTTDTCNPSIGCENVDNTLACDDGEVCTVGDMCGGGTCGGTQLGCADSDGCCAAGCNNNNDDDCAVVCGNGVVEAGETCDGDCPTSCTDDGDACTVETLQNPEACDAYCQVDTITWCAGADGCCPAGAGCNNLQDSDCSPVCPNGVTETGEQCDDGNSTNGDGCQADCTTCTPVDFDDDICDGLDDDCDGQVDEDCVTCVAATDTIADHVSAGRVYAAQGSCTGSDTIFSEGFESGTLANWTVVSGDVMVSSGSNAVHSGNEGARFPGPGEIRTTIDTSTHTGVTLQYWRRSYSMESSDYFRVRYSTDGGASFTTLEAPNGTYSWTESAAFALPSHPSLVLSFWADFTYSSDYGYLDDIVVSGTESCADEYFVVGSDESLGTDPTATVSLRPLDTTSGWATIASDDATCDGENDDCDSWIDEDCPPACMTETATCADHVTAGRAYEVVGACSGDGQVVFADGFESGTLDGWTVTSGNAFVSDGSSLGPHAGSYVAEMTGPPSELRVTVDTSAFYGATLQYWHGSYDAESADELSVRYSTDGGASFTVLETTADQHPWTQSPQFELPLDSNLIISILADYSGSGDRAVIDDFEVRGYTECARDFFAVGSAEFLGADPGSYVSLRQLSDGAGWATVKLDDTACGGEDDDCDGAVDEDCVPFEEASGVVSLESEHWMVNVMGSSAAYWELVSSSGASGLAMQASPEAGLFVDTGYDTESPRLDYDVTFSQTGTYYVWFRYRGVDTGSDSIHVGLDGNSPASGAAIGTLDAPPAGFEWLNENTSGGRATLYVSSTGTHTINMWMREDGVIVDKLVLTTDSNYVPTGDGPPESSGVGQ